MKCLRIIGHALAAATILVLAGCATPSHEVAHGSGPVANCSVCQYNNDLACVCVTVKESTPRTDYQGITYHFCSASCRAAFLKSPEKYRAKQ